jgi:ATP-binding protein involved in chromosome partitioning
MKHPSVLIKKIYQKDNFTFIILWSDGLETDFRLGALQKKCPCAQCYNPTTGKQRMDEQHLDQQVRAVHVKSVGRYALRIQFTSGCSKGIYSFAMLRQLVKEKANV